MYLKKEAFSPKSLEKKKRLERKNTTLAVLTRKNLLSIKSQQMASLTGQSHICKEVFAYFYCKVLLNNYIDMIVWFRKTAIFLEGLVLIMASMEFCQPLLAPHIM